MDPKRFDSLTRSLAAPKSRRGLLGSLAALGAGLLGARAADAQQVTQAQCGNVVCYNRGTRTVDVACKAGCVCCVYRNGNSRCTPPGNCTGTPTCPPGQVLGPSGVCAACGGSGQPCCPGNTCTDDGDPCTDNTCVDGRCAFSAKDCEAGKACCGGACKTAEGERCSTDAECCGACSSEGVCCASGVSCGNVCCSPGAKCAPEGHRCCETGVVCANGVCCGDGKTCSPEGVCCASGVSCGEVCCASPGAKCAPQGHRCCETGVVCGGACCPNATDVCDQTDDCTSG